MVALSFAEVGYIVASMTSCEAVWLRKLFSELFGLTLDTIVILYNNQRWDLIIEESHIHRSPANKHHLVYGTLMSKDAPSH